MTNYQKIQEIYTKLTDTFYDLSNDIADDTEYDQIDISLETANRISVILERLGKTMVLELGEKPEQPEKKVEEDIVVEKGGEENK